MNITKLNNNQKEMYLSFIKNYNSDKFIESYDLCMNNVKSKIDAAKKEEYYKNYTNIIKRVVKLLKELNIEDPIKISIVYEYLLWNGYFSKDKKLVYSNKDRVSKPFLYPLDIMRGKSICLENAWMLRDIYRKLGYDSNIIGCYSNYNNNTIREYLMNIKRNYKIDNNIFSFITNKIEEYNQSKIMCNHALTLVKSQNQLILCDPTQLDFLYFSDVFKAQYICSDLEIYINPWMLLLLESHSKNKFLTLYENSIKEINKTKLNIEDIIKISDSTIEFCNNNSVFEDFYLENQKDINEICKKYIKK